MCVLMVRILNSINYDVYFKKSLCVMYFVNCQSKLLLNHGWGLGASISRMCHPNLKVISELKAIIAQQTQEVFF